MPYPPTITGAVIAASQRPAADDRPGALIPDRQDNPSDVDLQRGQAVLARINKIV
jgi:hypothetical protein